MSGPADAYNCYIAIRDAILDESIKAIKSSNTSPEEYKFLAQ